MGPDDLRPGLDGEELDHRRVVRVRLEVEIALHRDLRDALQHGIAIVRAVQVELADALVHAPGQPLLQVGNDGRIAPPRAHVVAGAIRAQHGHHPLGIAIVELEGAVVGRARDQGARDARLVEDDHDLVRRVDAPVGSAVVDVRVGERGIGRGGRHRPPREQAHGDQENEPAPH
jgi:hypothetical protein